MLGYDAITFWRNQAKIESNPLPMTTKNLTLWVHDRELSRALTELPSDAIRIYDWNWKDFHAALLKSFLSSYKYFIQ